MRAPDLPKVLKALEPTGWPDRARAFAASLRSGGHEPGRLLVVGTEQDEPWHLTAHLADAARWSKAPALEPVLVRHRVPEGARPHLAVDLSRLQEARQGTTVLVAAPGRAGEDLLERLSDVRRGGGLLLALHEGDDELAGLAHEELSGPVAFETASHVVTDAAANPSPGKRFWR